MTEITPQHIIRERDASRYLDLSVAWLRQRRRYGGGPSFVKIGRAVRYCTEDLDRFLQRHRVESGGCAPQE